MHSANSPSCGGKGGVVKTVSDGVNSNRCYTAIMPTSKTPKNGWPVLFWFHGSGGNAKSCGSPSGQDDHVSLYQLAQKNGFALICGESLQGHSSGHSGQWDIPEIINETNDYCSTSVSIDMAYMKNILKQLSMDSMYDVSRVFTAGCSMGSAFSIFSSGCLKQDGLSISAFATHSTGLKKKGDGIGMPPEWHNPRYNWGECPNCEYFPTRPVSWTKDSLGFKACIFDNTGDWAYQTSVNLASTWKALGNNVETIFLSGRHCQIHSFSAIVDCLDDGTGRLKTTESDVILQSVDRIQIAESLVKEVI